MSRKRKSGAAPLDEVERTLYSSFCNAANSLSQLYTQAMNHQKVAFQAGERHAMEKLYQWILKQHEDGSRVTATDIVTHIENYINCGGDATSMSPRVQHQLPQTITNSSTPAPLGSLGPLNHLVVSRNSHAEQAKETMFSNALSSPVRRSLQSYHQSSGGQCYHTAVLPNGYENSSSHSRETHSPTPNDSSMEMH